MSCCHRLWRRYWKYTGSTGGLTDAVVKTCSADAYGAVSNRRPRRARECTRTGRRLEDTTHGSLLSPASGLVDLAIRNRDWTEIGERPAGNVGMELGEILQGFLAVVEVGDAMLA
jgi:hypothetical protein